MKVTILGTGTFFVNKERSGPAYLLEYKDKKILIDCGPGTLMRLSQLGIAVEDINYVFLTHFHPDHSGDLFAFQMNFRLREFFGNKDDKRFPEIYGPEGIEEFTKNLSNIYQLPAFDNFLDIKYIPYQEEIHLGGLTVRAIKVEHIAFGLPADAYALRFEVDDKIFTFSGDATRNKSIEKACKQADLFICDASSAKGKSNPAHMDTLEIGEIAENSKVKKVVLTHFYPNNKDYDLVSEVLERYSGEVIKAEDFMEFKI